MPHDAMHPTLTSRTKLPEEAILGASPSTLQRTLFASSAALEGVGVHTGQQVAIRLIPASENTGIVFIRTDLVNGARTVPARWDCVVDTQLCTVIDNGHGGRVRTIEHLMAALYAYGIDNVVIEINAEEVPVMDGSSAAFIALIEEAGVVELKAPRREIEILHPVEVIQDGKFARFTPADETLFCCEIDFDRAAIGRQRYDFTLSAEDFKAEIGRARTFGFSEEVEQMKRAGFARGGSLENAVIIEGDKVINQDGLRYGDEFVRHKLLDAVGDLALAGAPIRGQFHGYRSGHALNNKLLRALFADTSSWRYVDTDSLANLAKD